MNLYDILHPSAVSTTLNVAVLGFCVFAGAALALVGLMLWAQAAEPYSLRRKS